MSHFVKILLVLGLLNTGWLNTHLGAQGWQDHFSYRQSFALAETPEAIYAATRLGLVVYSKDDQALTTLNKINGLSDYGISSLADRKSTRLNSSHVRISYAVFCLKKKKNIHHHVIFTY